MINRVQESAHFEVELHRRLSDKRVALVNRKREFFRAAPLEVKELLAELAGEMSIVASPS